MKSMVKVFSATSASSTGYRRYARARDTYKPELGGKTGRAASPLLVGAVHEPPAPTIVDAKREQRRQRQRRYRRRYSNGLITVLIEIDATIVEMLVTSSWLAEADAGDRQKIARAIGAMLADSSAK